MSSEPSVSSLISSEFAVEVLLVEVGLVLDELSLVLLDVLLDVALLELEDELALLLEVAEELDVCELEVPPVEV